MERIWEAHRSSCEPAMARHVPQALEPSSSSLERLSAQQIAAVARPAARCRGETSCGRLSRPSRTRQFESGIERTGPAEARTEPQWVALRDDPGSARVELGERTECGFAGRDAGKPRGGAHQNLRQFRLPLGFPRSNQGQDQALVQRPHLRQPRARPPCPGGTKTKSLTKEISSVARPAEKCADLRLGILPAHERQKFVARLLIVAESAEHGAGHCGPVLLLHAAHLHAEMASFDNHADTLGGDFFLYGVRDLAGHALLNLEAARKHVDHAGDLAEP